MAQNIYDNQQFFEGYAQLERSVQVIHDLDSALEWSSLKQMLPELNGSVVADLGCGYGWFCRYAKQSGAKYALGVDISWKMLERARELTHDDNITYRNGDLESLELEECKYNLVFSSLALHYIENLAKLIETVFGSLRAGGHFVFSVEHPIYTAPENPSWMVDEQTGKRWWPLNQYHQEGKRVTNWIVEGIVKQHRLMSTYLNLLIDNGFIIKNVQEWSPGPEQIRNNPGLAKARHRPLQFFVSAQKPH